MLVTKYGLFYRTFNPVQISFGVELWVGEFIRIHLGPLSFTWAYKKVDQ